MEKQFRIYVEKALKSKGNTGEALLILLEKRLDNVDYKLGQCVNDNDFLYLSKNGFVQDKWLSYIIIDIKICNPLHYSWLNNDRSRKKVEYQKKRGWNTSFNWNYNKNCLEFNEEYYKNKEKPILYKLNED